VLRDRITVLDFWFINCPPCRGERPKLNEIVAEFGDKVCFVGFALDAPDPLKAYVASNPYKYEVVPRSQEIADAFGVTSFPTHMVIDRAVKIVWLSGSDNDRIQRLRAVIVRVLASQPARPE
jgi:thiol-disulfide isomerase/thioredoxin